MERERAMRDFTPAKNRYLHCVAYGERESNARFHPSEKSIFALRCIWREREQCAISPQRKIDICIALHMERERAMRDFTPAKNRYLHCVAYGERESNARF